jgi:hypothetical protein
MAGVVDTGGKFANAVKQNIRHLSTEPDISLEMEFLNGIFSRGFHGPTGLKSLHCELIGYKKFNIYISIICEQFENSITRRGTYLLLELFIFVKIVEFYIS